MSVRRSCGCRATAVGVGGPECFQSGAVRIRREISVGLFPCRRLRLLRPQLVFKFLQPFNCFIKMSPRVDTDTLQTLMHRSRVRGEPPRLNNRPPPPNPGLLIACKNNDLILVHHNHRPPFCVKNASRRGPGRWGVVGGVRFLVRAVPLVSNQHKLNETFHRGSHPSRLAIKYNAVSHMYAPAAAPRGIDTYSVERGC